MARVTSAVDDASVGTERLLKIEDRSALHERRWCKVRSIKTKLGNVFNDNDNRGCIFSEVTILD